MEIWKPIEGYEGLYEVSNLGRVRRLHKTIPPRVLKLNVDKRGYFKLDLCRNNRAKSCSIHRLVAQAFIPNPEDKPCVNHINGNKLDNRVENLEWVTSAENAQHAAAMGLAPHGESHYKSKLTDVQVVFVRENPDNLSGAELARRLNVSEAVIRDAQIGKCYKHVGGRIRGKIEHRIPDEIREQIRSEYRCGVCKCSSRVLAKRFGIAHTTILKIIHEK